MTKVFVTGANGFVGQALSTSLEGLGKPVVRATREGAATNQTAVGDIGPNTDWGPSLEGCEVVIHLAARVHVMHDSAADPLQAFYTVNTEGTLNLAKQAAQHGVRRFIFLSSIKVNGEETFGAPFTPFDQVNPQDPYALSKWEAEKALKNISTETGMEYVILRPPLVYGPRVKANFLRLLRWVDQGIPLPLASVDNRRSMIYIGNLVSALIACTEYPGAAGNTYLVSDGKDVSTADLIRMMSCAMGRSDRLWFLPVGALNGMGKVLGKSLEMQRLLGSLQVESHAITKDLGWVPPYSVEQGLEETVNWYLHRRKR